MFRTFLFIYQYSFSSKIIGTCHLIKQMPKAHINTGFQHFLSLYSYYTQATIRFNVDFCITIVIKMSTLNSTFFHIFIVLPFCTIRSLFYCIFSLLGSAIVRLPLLPASHAPYFRSYASCFTSSSNSSPAE